MSENKFYIELSLIREDEQEGITTDLAIVVAIVFNEEAAGELFKTIAATLGMEEHVR